jgi:hypothetical protein
MLQVGDLPPYISEYIAYIRIRDVVYIYNLSKILKLK